MTKLKKLTSLLIVMSMLAILCSGCGLSEDDAVGTWSGTYEYNGNSFAVVFALMSDGTYEKITMKNGETSSMEDGDWEVKGNKVTLYDSSAVTYHGQSTVYTYKSDALVNNDHYFYKVS